MGINTGLIGGYPQTGGQLDGSITFPGAQTVDGVDISTLLTSDMLYFIGSQGIPWTLAFTSGNVQSAVTGNGVVYGNFVQYIDVRTGAGASTARAFYGLYHSNAKNWGRFAFNNRQVIVFPINPTAFLAGMVVRVQIKTVSTHGDLAALGIGVICKGTTGAFSLETHNGTSRTETDLSWTPGGTDRTVFAILDHDPSMPRIRVKLCGGEKAASAWTSVTATIPVTETAGVAYLVYSIENAGGEADCEVQCPNPFGWAGLSA